MSHLRAIVADILAMVTQRQEDPRLAWLDDGGLMIDLQAFGVDHRHQWSFEMMLERELDLARWERDAICFRRKDRSK